MKPQTALVNGNALLVLTKPIFRVAFLILKGLRNDLDSKSMIAPKSMVNYPRICVNAF